MTSIGNNAACGYLAPVVSGGTTIAASDNNALAITGTNTPPGASRVVWLTIASGVANVFQVAAKNATGGSADTFSNVQLEVWAP